MAKLVGADLFCGAGGVTCGMRRAGVDVRIGIDLDPRFKQTFEANNSPARYWQRDISTVSGEELGAALNLEISDKFVLSACAPCQPFSRQNKRGVLRGHLDERSDLLDEVTKILKELPRKPDYLFIENVPGINHSKNSALSRLEETLYALKYTTVSGVVDAAKYGVPQHRKRFVLLAKLGISFVSLPPETHGPGGSEPYRTVESIRQYPAIAAGEISESVANHQTRQLSALNLTRIRAIPRNGGSRKALKTSLVLQCHKDSSGHNDVYGRLAWDKPAPTITTKCVSLSNGRFGHPEQDRAISVREAACLQSFPDSYRFYGSGIDSEARQVGNAVPVLLAEAVIRHLISL